MKNSFTLATYRRLEATATPLLRLHDAELFDHDDGLNPPVSNSDVMPALIFLLFDSNSKRFLSDMEDPDEPGKIEAAVINARFSFLFLSNLEENFMRAAVAASSSVAGSNRMPSPSFFETDSSSATLFF